MVALRVMSLSLALAGIIIWLFGIRSRRMHWHFAVAPLSWLINVACFYTVRLIHLAIPVEYLNTWSSVIHMHALLLLTGAGVIYYQWRKDG